MNRRHFIKQVSLLAANTALVNLPQNLIAAPAVHIKKTFRVGIFAPSHCSAPLVYASMNNLFKKQGLQVELINYPVMAKLAKDLLSNVIDLGQIPTPLVFAIYHNTTPFPSGVPLVIPMILGVHGSNLMVRNGAGISRPADFKNKTIATNSKFSIHYLLTKLFLSQYGIDTEKEVRSVNLELKDLATAMKNGTVDACMMPEPMNAIIEDSHMASTFLQNKFLWRYHPCCGLTMKKDRFAKHRQQIKDLVTTVTQASLFINKERNRETLVSMLQKTPYGYADIPEHVLKLAFMYERSAYYPFPYKSTAQVILKMMRNLNLLPDISIPEVAHEVFLSDFMRECLAAIDVKAPRKNSRPEYVLGKIYELDS